jgi:hypothetical protein
MFTPPRNVIRISAAAAAATMVSGQAHAQNSLGNFVGHIADDIWQPFWILLLGGAFILGMWLVATGLGKLKEGGHGHQGNGHMEGIARIIGGALLIGLPDTLGAGIFSFYGTVSGHAMGSATIGATTDCTAGGGVTCVAQNVAQNLVPVFVEVSFGLFFLFGAYLIASAVHELATSHAAGQRQGAKGALTRAFMGALCCNIPYLFAAIEGTMGITGGTIITNGFDTGSSMLTYNGGSNGVLANYSQLIGFVFQILVMFGVMSVWKGITYLRAYAEGNERGGAGPGLTHVLGGALLANAKYTTCIVATTFIGNNLGFC